MSISQVSRRQFLKVTIGLATSIGTSGIVAVTLWQLGKRSRGLARTTHRISGGSMAPTLWGEHFDVTCPHCHMQFRIDASATSSLANSTPDNSTGQAIPCWHCGVDHDRPTGTPNPGELIGIEPITESSILTRGQLVAINIDGELHVKRLLGLPRDVVSLADQTAAPPRLCCNGQLTSAPGVTIAVERDSLREVSRWSSRDGKHDIDSGHRVVTPWQRKNTSWKCTATSELSAALVYTHRSVHDFNQVTAILDDCPANALLIRTLYPVSTLVLRTRLTCDRSVRLITSLGEREFDPGIHDVELRGSTDQLKLAVIAEGVEGSVSIERLAIDREIEYRLRPSDQTSAYPMTLGAEEYYIVGDNVPVSVDSRNFGRVRRDQIVGIVS